VLWTGCQWKAVERAWFGVCSSSLHAYFQEWSKRGGFAAMMRVMAAFSQTQCGVGWTWQRIDSRSCSAPLGGQATGKNPTDRAKRGSTVDLLVDEHGAPLAVHGTGANEHDKWSADDWVLAIGLDRPDSEPHLCADRGYAYPDVHQFTVQQNYIPHIKPRRRRGEPPPADDGSAPGEAHYPARRWGVERTFGWLVKRRS
jgi:putative transposase